MAPDDRLMAVSVTLNRTGPSVEVGKPVALFTTRPQSRYAATPDGQRFLVNTPLADTSTAPITVILNWAGQKK
jgi:hypothetical protein